MPLVWAVLLCGRLLAYVGQWDEESHRHKKLEGATVALCVHELLVAKSLLSCSVYLICLMMIIFNYELVLILTLADNQAIHHVRPGARAGAQPSGALQAGAGPAKGAGGIQKVVCGLPLLIKLLVPDFYGC